MDLNISNDTTEKLKQWQKQASEANQQLALHLGVDIGGTNTRVALLNRNQPPSQNIDDVYLVVGKFKSSTIADLLAGLTSAGSYLAATLNVLPLSACLAAAGPVSNQGQTVVITNYTGEKTLHVSQLPTNLFPKTTRIINDLASTCDGINALSQYGKLSEFFAPLWGKSGEENMKLKPVNYLVLAMGTGLGCGLLVAQSNKDQSVSHQVLPLETGHVTLTQLGNENTDYKEEQSLLNHISKKLYNGEHTLEFEDICSGRGLGYCYEWATKDAPDADKNVPVFEIVKKATSNPPDPYAEKAVFLHYKYLFRSAQQQCIGLQAKGVFLAGDNQVSNDPFVSKHTEGFKQDFLNHPKRSWIQDVPVYRQIKSYNLNLLGALFVAKGSWSN